MFCFIIVIRIKDDGWFVIHLSNSSWSSLSTCCSDRYEEMLRKGPTLDSTTVMFPRRWIGSRTSCIELHHGLLMIGVTLATGTATFCVVFHFFFVSDVAGNHEPSRCKGEAFGGPHDSNLDCKVHLVADTVILFEGQRVCRFSTRKFDLREIQAPFWGFIRQAMDGQSQMAESIIFLHG